MKKYDSIITKKILYIEYIVYKKTILQISKIFNCSTHCIYGRLDRFSIKVRNNSECHIGIKNPKLARRNRQYCWFKGKSHTEETKHKIKLKHLGKHCSPKTEFKKGQKLSIQTKRKLSLIRGGTGIPYERSEYSVDFYNKRQLIKKRDNYKCKLCGNKGNDIHHINYNTSDNSNKNLITLCRNCHCKTINNRDYWYAYFTYIKK
jgi:hypothetical protein